MDCTKIKQTYYDTCEPNREITEYVDRPLQCVEIIKKYITCTTNIGKKDN